LFLTGEAIFLLLKLDPDMSGFLLRVWSWLRVNAGGVL